MSTVTHVPERPALGPVLRIAAAVLPVAATAIVGSVATQGEIPGWYAGLNKPAFNPPNWLFPVAWTILYAMIAYAAWRLLGAMPRTGPSRQGWWLAILAFAVQLALNAAWSPVFFTAHAIGPALVVVVALLVMVLWTIRLSWRFDRLVAWLLVPYAAWVSFATLLNAAILRLN
ncbi:TspO/MBR family protein [Methylobacterium dankookense]|uniref:Tryptophan-rich protein TspO n=1 Tax=Methylobacterium dankookense TaxID=560405 RepID=A0A564FVD8_9HYPH|nr:TspO/MBR family protein [Methylobacterium dankookense]GJD57502.1 Tryptophan-rich protein TspO [Methylobacterium dankookense]VUF11650.1 Tryptophan-rich protein TspO [Methylobacterium dankookense]